MVIIFQRSFYLMIRVSFLLVLFSLRTVEAQEDQFSGQITYLQNTGIPYRELTSLVDGSQSTYSFGASQCGAYSDDGERIAVSSLNGEYLQIIRWLTGQILYETNWRSDWIPCDIVFSSDDHLISIGLETTDLRAHVDYRTQIILVGPSSIGARNSPFDDLPNLQSKYWTAFSATNRLAFYARCVDGLLYSHEPDIFFCSTETQWVIYDLIEQQTTHVFDNFDLSGITAIPRTEVVLDGLAWSPNEQYFAYLKPFSTRNSIFPLAIFDIVTGAEIELPYFSSVPIAIEMGLRWSPDSSHIAFWTEGRPYADEQVRTLVIYHVENHTYTVADQSLEPRAFYLESGRWSPDSAYFAYVTQQDDLFVIDTASGEMTLLDTNVWAVLSWKSRATE